MIFPDRRVAALLRVETCAPVFCGPLLLNSEKEAKEDAPLELSFSFFLASSPAGYHGGTTCIQNSHEAMTGPSFTKHTHMLCTSISVLQARVLI